MNKTKRKIATTSENWSDLPEDLASVIANKLHSFDDILSFRSVCATWRSASTTDSINVANHFPWMLQAKEAHGVNNKRCMFDLVHNKLYESSKFSHEFKTLCLGWKGWVLAVKKNGTMRLLQAFKNSRSLSLPDKKSLQEGRYDRITVCKAVLSADPSTNQSDYILVIIYKATGKRNMAFWRPGDKVYTKLQVSSVCDAAFHGGQLYAANRHGVMVFDVAGLDLTYRLDGNIPHLNMPMDLDGMGCNMVELGRDLVYLPHLSISMDLDGMGCYLVELGRDLVYIAALRRFNSMKFILLSVSDGWKVVEDIGNKAIFIGGTTQSFALDDASEIPGCKPNHIYFTALPNGGCGIYNCTNARVEFFDCTPSKYWYSCPHSSLWVQPTFH